MPNLTRNMLRFHSRWLSIPLVGLLSGCPGFFQPPSPLPVSSQPDPVVLAPSQLVLNLPAEGTGLAPFPATGAFALLGGDRPGSWRIENPAIASIDARGQVVAHATGSTWVWFEAAQGAGRASAAIEVLDRGGLAQVGLQ